MRPRAVSLCGAVRMGKESADPLRPIPQEMSSVEDTSPVEVTPDES
jgi:hypothetical protein